MPAGVSFCKQARCGVPGLVPPHRVSSPAHDERVANRRVREDLVLGRCGAAGEGCAQGLCVRRRREASHAVLISKVALDGARRRGRVREGERRDAIEGHRTVDDLRGSRGSRQRERAAHAEAHHADTRAAARAQEYSGPSDVFHGAREVEVGV